MGGVHILEDMIVYRECMYGGLHIFEDMIVYRECMYGGCTYIGRHGSVYGMYLLGVYIYWNT